jgi:ubiquinone/menaquinone biosynthesis C-methylase UbiE
MKKEDITAGQAIYTPTSLKFYDLFVTHLSNRWIWRCDNQKLLKQYERFMGENHLDIGVGTGFYLRKCDKSHLQQLTLMDLNEHCLSWAKQHIDFSKIQTIVGDVFKRHENLKDTFDSISINYLLHCIPGSKQDKEIAIKSIGTMLKPGGRLFGATIVSDTSLKTFMSNKLMGYYNRKKIFSNKTDTLQSIKEILDCNLDSLEIYSLGCVALFNGVKK